MSVYLSAEAAALSFLCQRQSHLFVGQLEDTVRIHFLFLKEAEIQSMPSTKFVYMGFWTQEGVGQRADSSHGSEEDVWQPVLSSELLLGRGR